MANNLIVAVFPSRTKLTEALDHLMHNEEITINRAAIVARAASGETIILDDDISADEGGVAGGTLGAAMAALGLVQLGALALPGVGPIIAVGAGALVGLVVGRATGRFAANLLDFGFKNDQVDELAHQLEQGHPALVLEIANADTFLPRLRLALKPYGAELVEPIERANTSKLRPPTART